MNILWSTLTLCLSFSAFAGQDALSSWDSNTDTLSPLSYICDGDDRFLEGTVIALPGLDALPRKRTEPLCEDPCTGTADIGPEQSAKRQRLLSNTPAQTLPPQAHVPDTPYGTFLHELDSTLSSNDHIACSSADPGICSIDKNPKKIPESRCPHDCSFSTTKIDQWITHLKFLHNITTPGCPYHDCNYTAGNRYVLYRHITNIHSNERPFKCNHPGCPFSFHSNSHLKDHQKTHSTEKIFACTYPRCHLKYKHKRSLLRHIEKIHGHLPGEPNNLPPSPTPDSLNSTELDHTENQSTKDLDLDAETLDADTWLCAIFAGSALAESSDSSSSTPETGNPSTTLAASAACSSDCPSETSCTSAHTEQMPSACDRSDLTIKFIEHTIYRCPFNCGTNKTSIRSWANHLQIKHGAIEGRCPFENCNFYTTRITDITRKLLYKHTQDKHPSRYPHRLS